jgi:uncharacterized protein
MSDRGIQDERPAEELDLELDASRGGVATQDACTLPEDVAEDWTASSQLEPDAEPDPRAARRTSSYTIYVALPDNDDEMLLVHGYTGAYDKVSRRVAEYLLSQESGPPPEPLYGEWSSEPSLHSGGVAEAPSEPTLEVLEKRGYLTRLSVEEEQGRLARTAKVLHRRAVENGPNYLFMPTYQCNLRCPYCFQDHMRTDPAYSHLLRTISRETVDRILATFPTLERSHGIEDGDEFARTVGFYGGEPFLAENRPIIEYIMNGVRALGPVNFWAVSNATQLDAYADLIGPEGIASIQITIDGPPEEHDKRRIHADGSGSFAQIARNVDLCLDRGAQVQIRMNIDRNNLHQLPRVAEEFVARGWDKRRGFMVYTARIAPANDQTPLSSTFNTTWELDQGIDELRALHPAMKIIGRPDDGLEYRARKLFEGRGHGLAQFKSSFCGAHSGMYIFDAFGDIYACWEKTGDARIRIGRVLDGGQVEMNQGLNKMWRSRTPASNPTCRKCRYAFQCGGGCAVLAEGQKGKFFTNYCDGFADRFRHSVAKAYLDFVNGTEIVVQERVCDL